MSNHKWRYYVQSCQKNIFVYYIIYNGTLLFLLLSIMASTHINARSSVKSFFSFLLVLLILGVVSIIVLMFLTKKTQASIVDQDAWLSWAKKKIQTLGKLDDYKQFDNAEYIYDHTRTIPWSERISKIIDVLRTLQSLTYEDSNSIILSDFTVSLEKFSLKWKVSALKLLYHNSPDGKYKSVIDMFKELDFVDLIEIKKYTSSDDMIEFSLDANLTLADGSF